MHRHPGAGVIVNVASVECVVDAPDHLGYTVSKTGGW